jgi:hypothetical protein
MHIVAQRYWSRAPQTGTGIRVELVGQDRPGIVMTSRKSSPVTRSMCMSCQRRAKAHPSGSLFSWGKMEKRLPIEICLT